MSLHGERAEQQTRLLLPTRERDVMQSVDLGDWLPLLAVVGAVGLHRRGTAAFALHGPRVPLGCEQVLIGSRR